MTPLFLFPLDFLSDECKHLSSIFRRYPFFDEYRERSFSLSFLFVFQIARGLFKFVHYTSFHGHRGFGKPNTSKIIYNGCLIFVLEIAWPNPSGLDRLSSKLHVVWVIYLIGDLTWQGFYLLINNILIKLMYTFCFNSIHYLQRKNSIRHF